MTMFVRRWTASLLAVAGVIVWTSASQAADVFRLAMPSNTDTPTMTLGSAASDDAETIDVRGFRGGFCGGYRGGFCGGYRGGIGCGVFRGGGRILNGCGRAVFGCRPAIGYGYCAAPIYSYYSSGYSCYPYYSGGYSCYPSYSYYPIATDLSLPSATFSLRINPLVPRIVAQPLSGTQVPLNQAPLGDPVPYPTPGLMPPADGTYDYDGGPRLPVPMPKVEPAPTRSQPPVPLDGRPVSLPRRTQPKYNFPAYGEQPRYPAEKEDTLPVRNEANRRVQR